MLLFSPGQSNIKLPNSNENRHTFIRNLNIYVITLLYRTPLMASVGNGFVDCVNLLLAEGANIQALDVYHRSALHRAVSNHSQAVVTFVVLESTLH